MGEGLTTKNKENIPFAMTRLTPKQQKMNSDTVWIEPVCTSCRGAITENDHFIATDFECFMSSTPSQLRHVKGKMGKTYHRECYRKTFPNDNRMNWK